MEEEAPDIETRFKALAEKWRNETCTYSSVVQIINSRYYNAIICLGEAVLPYIFRDMQKAPDHWFYALEKITKAQPVRKENKGKIQAMTEDWLQWAKDKLPSAQSR